MSAITLAEANGLILISKKWTAREQANDQFPEIFWLTFWWREPIIVSSTSS